MSRIRLFILVIVVGLSLSSVVFAGEKYAVGMQSGMTGGGLSGKYFIDDKLAANLIISSGFGFSAVTGRGLYTFKEEKQYDLYGFGEVGAWFVTDNGSHLNIGAGAGIVANWQNWIEDIFPLYWNLEVGVGSAFGYTYSPVRINGGVHYRF